jgi:tungstate transport system substrate-binding protein
LQTPATTETWAGESTLARAKILVDSQVSCRAACALVALLSGCGGTAQPVVLATTTSVSNSRLLDRVLPAYDGPTVQTIQVGSGRALEMLARGTADVVISHAPEREAEMLRRHQTWLYRKVLYNDFIIVGPPADPAGIAGTADAVEAVRRIANAGERFLSRGDESGTHERERKLWIEAGIVPSGQQAIVAGAGMGQTLRIASQTGAYTLTDRGTFEALERSIGLRVLVSGDPRLLNTYAVIADSLNDQGIRLARWLADGNGQQALSEALLSGEVRGFTVWPAARKGTRPDARPF